MARASIRSLCIAACALVVLGATCRRQPATPERETPPEGDAGVATGDAETPADTTAAPAARLRGLIAPHAGYEYSGAVAAWSWKQLEGSGVRRTEGEGQEESGDVGGRESEVGGGVFPAQVAGGFYPGDAATLRSQVQGFLGAAEKRADLRVAPVATVILMAPSHHYPFSGAAALAEDAYETPLGRVSVDTALRSRLVELASGDVVVDTGYFREEHALEVQLPFLQTVLPNAKVLPLIVGESNLDQLERLGQAVAKLLEEREDAFLVASSDMSHFYTYEEATAFDQANLAALEALDLDTYDRTGNGQSGMCGYNPVRVALVALKEIAGAGAKVIRLKYANSGDVTGDHGRVVGYGALALVQEEGARSGAGSGTGSGATAGAEGNMFSREERQALMDIAKAAVRAAARGERYAPEEPLAEGLRRNGAAFVTLKESGQLRGCIGHVIATEPLFECVAEVARAAAIEDPRFDPVEPRELDKLSFEISVLTPPEVVTDPTTIQVGRDGLIMSRGGRRGLLLPQVPEEQGWDREQFLDGTCRKAGLPAGCWREPGTRIERFQAIVWGESLEDILT